MGPSGRPGNAGTDVSEIINVSVSVFLNVQLSMSPICQSLFSADFGDETPKVSSWYKKKNSLCQA